MSKGKENSEAEREAKHPEGDHNPMVDVSEAY